MNTYTPHLFQRHGVSEVPISISQDLVRPVAKANTAKRFGPTLIEMNSAPIEPIFASIHRAVRPGTPCFDRYKESKNLCKTVYENRNYEYQMSVVEEYDNYSVILYSRNSSGEIEATLRICTDSLHKLPIADSLPEIYLTLRDQGLSIGEPGRFTVSSGSKNFRRYVSAAYEIGCHLDIDVYLLQIRSEQTEFYQRFCNAKLLPSALAPPGCTNLIWHLAETPSKFFRAFGKHKADLTSLLGGEGGVL